MPPPASMLAVPPSPISRRSASIDASSSPKGRLEVNGSRWAGSNGMTEAASTRPGTTSAVPSPPSASGSSSQPPRPRASAAAAARAERTPLRLPGHASALGRDDILLGLLGKLRLRGARHHLQHRERQPLAREEEET